ncbi:hypothetical protein QFZ88_003411 [Mesorhizobium sp. YL-MeA3-2017]|jgi:hypothetical protein|nr:hypothetical protein [Mesorhizobium sp. YL-MeA3-2017]
MLDRCAGAIARLPPYEVRGFVTMIELLMQLLPLGAVFAVVALYR